MQRLGLSAADLRAYNRALYAPVIERRIEVRVMNLEGHVLRSLTPKVLDGQVIIDVTQTPTRILNLTFLDPSRSLAFEPDSPAEAPLHRSRMVQIIDSRRVPELDEWIDCAVFTGPMWNFERNGAEVTITAHGKERQALGNKWITKGFAKKSKKTTMIRTLLQLTGEAWLSIPDLRYTLPNRISVHRMDVPWNKVKRVARSMNRHLFYDGRGWARLRPYPTRPVFTFHKTLLAEPEVRRDVEGLVNLVWVVGGKPKGQKRRVQATARLPHRHPLSPESLGRNGSPLYLVEKVVNPHIKTIAEAKRRAIRIRDDRARITTEFSFDSLPVPHLDEQDMVAVQSDDGRLLVRMRQWTIPLGPDPQPMTVGTLRRTTRARRR